MHVKTYNYFPMSTDFSSLLQVKELNHAMSELKTMFIIHVHASTNFPCSEVSNNL